jgi:hypothetical protein
MTDNDPGMKSSRAPALSLTTCVLDTGAGTIAVIRAALMIHAGVCSAAALTIERQQRLRDARFGFRFTVELRNEALDDLAHVNMQIGLYRDIQTGAVMASQPRQAIERLADRVQAGECDFQRTLLLGLAGDLINPVAQLQIGAAQRLFGWQQRQRRGAARRLLGDSIRRGELEAIGAVAIEARCRQPIVGGDARQRLAGGEAAGDFGALEMVKALMPPIETHYGY